MTQQDLDQKLEDLRKEYLAAGKGLRKLIEVRAKLLKKRFQEETEEAKQGRKEDYELEDAVVAWEKIVKNQKDA
jgi:ribosomal protein L29